MTLLFLAVSVESSPLDDLQLDALSAIARLRVDPSAIEPPAMKRLETLYVRGEFLRGKGEEEKAADLFRQVVSRARELKPAVSAGEATISDSDQKPSSPPIDGGDPPRAGDTAVEPEAVSQPIITELLPLPLSPLLTGTEDVYRPTRPESLSLISARLGVSSRLLARLNDLPPGVIVKPGSRIRYTNLRIVPKVRRNGIVINIPDRTLYLFKNGTLVKNIPVAVGKGSVGVKTAQSFETPTGPFRIVAKKRNPSWTPPPSIREEMAARNKPLPDVVPPGKDNPLGAYALVTSIPGILIHSTNLPSSVYGFSSHGCIRITPWEMERLFNDVSPSMGGEIIYEPIKLLVTDDRRVFLEANPDIYKRQHDPLTIVKRMIESRNVSGLVDWQKVSRVIRERKGIAEEVTDFVSLTGRNRHEVPKGS